MFFENNLSNNPTSTFAQNKATRNHVTPFPINGSEIEYGISNFSKYPFLQKDSNDTKIQVSKLQIKAGTNKEYAFFFNHIHQGLSLLSKKPLKKKKKGTAIIG